MIFRLWLKLIMKDLSIEQEHQCLSTKRSISKDRAGDVLDHIIWIKIQIPEIQPVFEDDSVGMVRGQPGHHHRVGT